MELKSRIELHKLLKDVNNSTVALLGVAEGYDALDICKWGVKKLYLVDLWGHIPTQTGDGNNPKDWHDKNYNDAMERVNGYPVDVLRGISWEMAVNVPNESLDLLYIDACHMYECVKQDLEAWYPKVKSGSVISGHDINNRAYGVLKAVEEFCYQHDLNYRIIPENGLDASFYLIKP